MTDPGSLTDLGSLTAIGVYAVVMGLVFVESGILIGFMLPGDTVLFAAGLVAARPDSGVSLPLLVTGTVVAAVAGDLVGYWTGARFGRPWLLHRAGRAARHVERAERLYARYGVVALIVARFIPWARTFVPILAGVARMRYSTFIAANVAGAVVWGAGLIVLGYVASTNPQARLAAYVVAGVAVALSVLVPVTAGVRRALRRRRERAAGPAPDLPPAAG